MKIIAREWQKAKSNQDAHLSHFLWLGKISSSSTHSDFLAGNSTGKKGQNTPTRKGFCAQDFKWLINPIKVTQVSVIKEIIERVITMTCRPGCSTSLLADHKAGWGKKEKEKRKDRSAALEREQLRLQPFQLWLSWLIYTLCVPYSYMGPWGVFFLLRVSPRELLGKLTGLGQRNETPLPGAKSFKNKWTPPH